MEQHKICSFFGHRHVLENIESQLLEHIKYAVEVLQVTDFYIGGYGSFDEQAKRAIIQMKKQYPNIKMYLTLAYMPTKNTFIDEQYDGSIFFEGLETGVKRFAISKRNRLMVQNSDVIICYITRDYGGAYTATKYAKNQGKLVLNCTQNTMF